VVIENPLAPYDAALTIVNRKSNASNLSLSYFKEAQFLRIRKLYF